MLFQVKFDNLEVYFYELQRKSEEKVAKSENNYDKKDIQNSEQIVVIIAYM